MRPKDGKRTDYGGTVSLGMKRGSLVRHANLGVVYLGGTRLGLLSLHSVKTGKRVTLRAKVQDCKFLCYNRVRVY